MAHRAQSSSLTKVTKDKLREVAAFQAGELFEHLTEPFADVSYIALRGWLINVAGLDPKKEKYEKFFEVLDEYIKLTELFAVQGTSEATKLDLKIAAKMKPEDYKDRRPLFEL